VPDHLLPPDRVQRGRVGQAEVEADAAQARRACRRSSAPRSRATAASRCCSTSASTAAVPDGRRRQLRPVGVDEVRQASRSRTICRSGRCCRRATARRRPTALARVPVREDLQVSTPLIEPGCRITSQLRRRHPGARPRAVPVLRLHADARMGRTCSALDEPDRPTTRTSPASPARPDRAPGPRAGCSTAADVVAHNPGARERSFYLWSAYVRVLADLGEIARAWLGQGQPEAEQSFINDTVGWPTSRRESDFAEWSRRSATAPSATGHKLGVIPARWPDLHRRHRLPEEPRRGPPEGLRPRRPALDRRVPRHRAPHLDRRPWRAALDKLLEETWPDEYGKRPSHRHAGDRRQRLDRRTCCDWARRHSVEPGDRHPRREQRDRPPLAPVRFGAQARRQGKRQQKRFYNLGVSA
jgi:hypothetical protein